MVGFERELRRKSEDGTRAGRRTSVARSPATGHEVSIRFVVVDEPAFRAEGQGVRGSGHGGAEVHGDWCLSRCCVGN